MVDKRNKMIDNSKVVYECLRCGRKSIGTLNTNPKACPYCKGEPDAELVIVDNLIVRK